MSLSWLICASAIHGSRCFFCPAKVPNSETASGKPTSASDWCRLLFVAALLELTSRTLESIAIELEYGSATALRNQMKRYTGLTATTVRGKGLEAVATLPGSNRAAARRVR